MPPVPERPTGANRVVDWVEYYEDAAGEWRWRAQAANGEIVADSGQGYADADGARLIAGQIFPGVEVRPA